MVQWNYDVMVQNQRFNSEINPTLIILKPYNVILHDDLGQCDIVQYMSGHSMHIPISIVPWNYDVMVQNQRLNSEIYHTLIHLKPYYVIYRDDSDRDVIVEYSSVNVLISPHYVMYCIMTLWFLIIGIFRYILEYHPTQIHVKAHIVISLYDSGRSAAVGYTYSLYAHTTASCVL